MTQIAGDLVPVVDVSIKALPPWSFWARPETIGSSKAEVRDLHCNKVHSSRIAEMEAARNAARQALAEMAAEGRPS
jgi:hypothetical protein